VAPRLNAALRISAYLPRGTTLGRENFPGSILNLKSRGLWNSIASRALMSLAQLIISN
jgi:hypothetical protein